MVFGNMGMNSGSGVGFTRDPASGEDRLYVDFLLNAQGEDIVAGRNAVGESEELIAAVPGLAHQLQQVRKRLEALFHDAQDFEFTVEDGTLWMLQTRSAKRTPLAALRIACDLVDEGLIDPNTAVQRLDGIRPRHDLNRTTRHERRTDRTRHRRRERRRIRPGCAERRVCRGNSPARAIR